MSTEATVPDIQVEGMGFEDNSTPGMPARDLDGTPICEVHWVRMKQYSGKKKVGQSYALHQCPHEGCKESGKKVPKRVEKVVPMELTACARCDTEEPSIVNKELSTAGRVILECPVCGHRHAPKPHPMLYAAHLQQRGRFEPESLTSE